MSEQSIVTEFRRTIWVGKFTVEIIVTMIAGNPIGTRFEWSPYYPGGLSGQALRLYRRRRNAVFVELSEQIGGHVLAIDEVGVVAIAPDGTEKAITGEGAK